MLRRVLLGLSSALAVCALAACASSSPSDGAAKAPADARAGEVHGADLWKDGLVLTGTVTIAADANVEISAGATIRCAEGATLFVAGTLRARAAAAHARITCSRWSGLVVSAGGHLDLEGIELENGQVGILTASGAAASTFTDGAILSSLKPLVIGPGSRLTISRSKLTTPVKVGADEVSTSEIDGTLIASRIDYDANAHEGVSVMKGGEIDLQDSTFHGTNAADLLSAYGAHRVKVAYSTFTGAHCGLHIQPSESFEIDHVTSESNVFGITIYGSGAGPNVVKSSNFTGTSAWLDFQGDNGAITFDGVYTNGSEVMTGGPPPSVKNKVTAPIGDAKPR